MKNVTRLLAKSMLLLMVSMMLFANAGQALVYVQIGTGTATTSHPFYALYADSRDQTIYLASEMSPTLGAGAITQIAFDNTSTGSFPLVNFSIRMKHTTSTTTTATFDEGGWTTVYSSASFSFAGTGWQIISLDTPFNWNGVNNLEIEFCHDNADAVWGSSWYVNGTTMASNMLRYAYTDYGAGCTLTGTVYTQTARPNIRLYQPGPGTLNGVVKNGLTNAPISGATVTVGSIVATTNGTGNYTMTVTSGTVSATATKATFEPQTKTTVVPEGGTATLNFGLFPQPAILNGIITNAANGAPVKGAKINVNGSITYSIEGGAYSLNVYAYGSYPIGVTKAGFENFTSPNYTFTSGVTQTVNIALGEALNKPSQPFTATLNTPPTQVALSWGVPAGEYELIYDDGVEETTTVWTQEGNMNALKFTALNYPVTIKGGSVNIGTADDYPGGQVPADLAPFQIQIYDATGTGGTPGAAIGDAIDVVPTSFGWNTFTLPDITIASGNFYMVMIQGGVPPVAARLAVDNTATQLRSYSKFVTGSGPWVPADGNFMMRCVVNGVGGPIDATESIIGYQVYRLNQGQELLPLTWTSVATPTATNTVDNSWPSLPDGAYRWAVKAKYTGNRWSDVIFSNVLGKNWTTTVTVNVSLTCAADPMAGTMIELENVNLPDTVYSAITGADGKANFTNVWKGNYHLTATRIFYDPTSMDVAIFGPSTFDIQPLHKKDPVTNFVVDGVTLESSWSPPRNTEILFNETWASGNFTANGWTTDASNWLITASVGNPAPSAEFYYSPEVLGYDSYLTSKVINASDAPAHALAYDIYLNNYSTSTVETMAVEAWNGSTWIVLDTYTNSADIPWTSKVVNLTPYEVNNTFKFRFHAAGEDSFNIDNWNIDNIQVVAMDAFSGPNPCVLGYNFYLNNLLSAFTPDTTYNIPPAEVQYGLDYTACVEAVYGSGYSARVCDDFNARFLCPPAALTGTAVESTAYLTWTKPDCGGCTPTSYIYDDGVLENGYYINPGAVAWLGNYFPIDAGTSGVIQSFDVVFWPTGGTSTPLTIDIFDATGTTILGSTGTFMSAVGPTWINVPAPNVEYTGPFFAMVKWNNAPSASQYLGLDESAPAAALALAYYYDETNGWMTIYDAGGSSDGVWTLRANVCEAGKKQGVAPIAKLESKKNGLVAMNLNQVGSSAGVIANMPNRAPAAAVTLLGYNIYRDGTPVGFAPGPNNLEYYDYFLDPGVYSYEVTAYYDVTPIPPLNDNSQPAGPVEVTINYGRPLPFYEPWDNGTFGFNDWTSDGNWVVSTAFGNPAPSADFPGFSSLLTNYSRSLTSASLSAAPYTCAKIWLDFDYKLIDRNATGNELLTVELFKEGSWKKIAEFANLGDVDWNTQHFELKNTGGKAFKIRFRANGDNSQDMLHWYVDNIHVYAVCQPAQNLVGEALGMDAKLNWEAPNCGNAGVLVKLWQWDGTPDNAWFQKYNYGYGVVYDLTAYPDASLEMYDFHHASWGTMGIWDYKIHIVDWTTYTELAVLGPFTTTGNDQWENGISLDGFDASGITLIGIMLEPLSNSATDAYPCFSGDATGPDGVSVYGDLSDYSAFADNGSVGDFLQNLWIRTEFGKGALVAPRQVPVAELQSNARNAGNNTNTYNGFLQTNQTAVQVTNNRPSDLAGYDIYRKDPNGTDFNKINPAIVTDTTYTDLALQEGEYNYYVLAVFAECTQTMTSDTVAVDIIVGIDPHVNGNFSVYPNPATEIVNVTSSDNITSIEVMNYLGQTVYNKQNVEAKSTKINVSGMMNGVYFVKVTTTQGIRTVKITVTH